MELTLANATSILLLVLWKDVSLFVTCLSFFAHKCAVIWYARMTIPAAVFEVSSQWRIHCYNFSGTRVKIVQTLDAILINYHLCRDLQIVVS